MVFPAGILQPPFFERGAPRADELRRASAWSWATSSRTASTTRAGSSTPRATCATGGRGPVNTEFEHARRSAWRSSSTATSSLGDAARQRQADARREHRRPRRHQARVRGVRHGAAAAKEPQQTASSPPSSSSSSASRRRGARKRADESARACGSTTNPHSPPQFRVNGPLSNLPEFAPAFQCKPGAKMVRKNQCTIW